MSYARFGWHGSDVYIYEHVSGFIECCGCSLAKDEDGGVFGFGYTHLKTPREALAHLDQHVASGDCVPMKTFERIRQEYAEAMDTPIEPYVTPPEVAERSRKRMRELFKMKEEK
jgi:hypothetical protein